MNVLEKFLELQCKAANEIHIGQISRFQVLHVSSKMMSVQLQDIRCASLNMTVLLWSALYGISDQTELIHHIPTSQWTQILVAGGAAMKVHSTHPQPSRLQNRFQILEHACGGKVGV